MRGKHTATCMAAIVLTMGTALAGTVSAPVAVNTSPSRNGLWSTARSNDVLLAWMWNAGASWARLDIEGMKASITTNFMTTTSNYLWHVFTAPVPSSEDVYDLALTFYDSTNGVVEAASARVAVIPGAFGETRVDTAPGSRTWPVVGGTALLSYDAAWTTETAVAQSGQLAIVKQEGMAQTNSIGSASGYFGWKVRAGGWGYGAFDLSLTFPGTSGGWTATLTRAAGGTLYVLK